MPSDDIVIAVRNLTKRYRLFGHPGDRVKQFMSLGLRRYHREFTALEDVSFDIRRGETVGIIGRNGSGKSTLLQLVCGILKPTSGTISVRGRVSALLELGAGFNPEFTGRENVYFQGALMGFTKAQMDAKFDKIAAFADIGEFIDQPVRTYSSGMYVRLAFSVAVHVDPEILVIDEALAVGDTAFQRKCFDLILALQEKNTTMLMVSHSPYWIERICHRAGIMAQGSLSSLWSASETLHRYHAMMQPSSELPGSIAPAQRSGTHELMFDRVQVETPDGAPATTVQHGDRLIIVADIHATRPISNVRFQFAIYNSSRVLVTQACSNGQTEGKVYHGRHRIAFEMTCCQLLPDHYTIYAHAADGLVPLDTWNPAAMFQVEMIDPRALDLSSNAGVFVCQGYWSET